MKVEVINRMPYHMVKNATLYQDWGAAYFDRRAKATQVARLVNRLQNLGFAVHITPTLPAPSALVSC